jgi:dolichol kinase
VADRVAGTGQLSYLGESSRKALHLVALVIPAGMLLLPRSVALPLLIVTASIAVCADLLRARVAGFGSVIDRYFGFMMRETERGAVPKSRLNGATWVLVSGALLLVVFPAEVAAPGMAMAMIGDAAAALVGRPFGRTRWPWSRRTVEGSAAFLAFGVVSGVLFPFVPWGAKAAAVGVATAAELIPIPINDNLILPFCASATLLVLTM